MTTEELRAAILAIPCKPPQGVMHTAAWQAGAMALRFEAAAIVAQSAAEDAEPINGDGMAATETWARSVLGKENVGRLYEGTIWIPEIRVLDQWVRLPKFSTRGTVRQLCSALGITLKETP